MALESCHTSDIDRLPGLSQHYERLGQVEVQRSPFFPQCPQRLGQSGKVGQRFISGRIDRERPVQDGLRLFITELVPAADSCPLDPGISDGARAVQGREDGYREPFYVWQERAGVGRQA